MLTVDIAKYLDGLGYVNFFQTGYEVTNNCFINNLPESPNEVVVLYDTGGEPNVVGFTETVRTFQVFVRGETQTSTNTLSWTIYKALISIDTHGYLNIDGRQLLIKAKNPPTFIGKDQNGLFEFSFNIQCWTQND
jgi:hypothetical protein